MHIEYVVDTRCYSFESDNEVNINGHELSDLSDIFEDDLTDEDWERRDNVQLIQERTQSLSLDDIPYDRDVKFINIPSSSRNKSAIENVSNRLFQQVKLITGANAGSIEKLDRHYMMMDQRKRDYDNNFSDKRGNHPSGVGGRNPAKPKKKKNYKKNKDSDDDWSGAQPIHGEGKLGRPFEGNRYRSEQRNESKKVYSSESSKRSHQGQHEDLSYSRRADSEGHTDMGKSAANESNLQFLGDASHTDSRNGNHDLQAAVEVRELSGLVVVDDATKFADDDHQQAMYIPDFGVDRANYDHDQVGYPHGNHRQAFVPTGGRRGQQKQQLNRRNHVAVDTLTGHGMMPSKINGEGTSGGYPQNPSEYIRHHHRLTEVQADPSQADYHSNPTVASHQKGGRYQNFQQHIHSQHQNKGANHSYSGGRGYGVPFLTSDGGYHYGKRGGHYQAGRGGGPRHYPYPGEAHHTRSPHFDHEVPDPLQTQFLTSTDLAVSPSTDVHAYHSGAYVTYASNPGGRDVDSYSINRGGEQSSQGLIHNHSNSGPASSMTARQQSQGQYSQSQSRGTTSIRSPSSAIIQSYSQDQPQAQQSQPAKSDTKLNPAAAEWVPSFRAH